MVNFWVGCFWAAVWVAAAMSKPTVTMIPQFSPMNVLMFGV